MKKLNRSVNTIAIHAAQDIGTTFYSITLDDALKVLRNENIILYHLAATKGWNAFDETRWIGGEVIDDVLYICSTDGVEIEVYGELVDPETALEDYGVEGIEPYLSKGTPEVIRRNLSVYELKPVNMDNVALELLEDDYSFRLIVSAAKDAGIIDLR